MPAAFAVLLVGLFVADVPARVHDWQLRRLSVAQLEERVRRDPADTTAKYRLGLAYARSNRHLEATRTLLAVVQSDPSRADAFNDLGVSYLFQERYHEALLALQGALAARPDFPEAHANLGRLYLNTRMPYSAVRELETAARSAPKRADILMDLGFAYIATMNFRSAEETYGRAIRLRPEDAAVHTGLGRAYHGLARYEEAERSLQRALQLDPDAPVANLVMAQVRVSRGAGRADLEAARDLLARSVKADSSDPDAWYELGRVTLKLDSPAEAVEHFRRALALSSEHGGAGYQLSRALRRMGRVAEADRVSAQFRQSVLRAREVGRIEERLQANPSDLDGKARLAQLYLESGRVGLAALIFRQLQDAAPGHPALVALRKELARRSPSGEPGAGEGGKGD